MATYSSDEVRLHASAQAVFDKLSNLEGLRSLIEQADSVDIPADKRQMLESIKLTPDTITVPGGGPLGEIKLRMAEKVAPNRITLQGEGTPVPLTLSMHIHPETDDSCMANVSIDLGIPKMMAPMVAGPMKNMMAQVATVLTSIPFKG